MTEHRDAKDYAIEHASYLATAATGYLDAINAEYMAQMDHEERPTETTEQALNEAIEAVGEANRNLRNCIYEFEKRRDRAALEAREPHPLSDADALSIHSMPYVRDCLVRYALCADDEAANEAVRSIVNAANGLMVGAHAVPVAWMWQHDETGRVGFIDPWQVENGWQENNPRLKLIKPLYASPVAADTQGDAQAVDEVMELARQYAHAYFNHYTGTTNGDLEARRQALQSAVAAMKEQPSDGVTLCAKGPGGCVAGECGKEEKRGL